VKFKQAKVLTTATLTLTVLFVSISIFPSTLAATSRMYLEPSNNVFTTDTAYLGMKFNVTVWCADIPMDILGAQITLWFNDSVVNVTRWWAPDWDFNFFMPAPVSVIPTPPNNVGYIHVGAGQGYVKVSVLKGGLPPVAPWGTNGTITILEFNITAVPTEQGKYTSSLQINNVDTYLKDTSNVDIPGVAKEDGYYEIKKSGPTYSLTISATSGGTTDPVPGIYMNESGTTVSVAAIPATYYLFTHWELNESDIGASNPVNITMDANYLLHAVFVYSTPEGSRIFVDPHEIIDPEAVPCQTNFNINISIDAMADVKTCEFNLTYNTDIISVIGLIFPSVNGQYPTLNLIVNDTAGFIWIKLAYSTAITVADPTPLAAIMFHVDSRGATPLNLTNTNLTNTYNNPIPHDVYHGYYNASISDVAVTNIMLSRTWVYQGWPVNITVTVKNKGNMTEAFNIHAYYNSHVIGTIAVTNLTSNEEKNVIFEWNTTGVAEGNYTIKAEAEPVLNEFNTSDNTLIDGDVWIMTHIHDIEITGVASGNWAYQGLTAYINVTAKNNGGFHETFNITAYCNTTLLGTVQVVNLAPGNYCEAQFSLNTSTLLPCHNYTIKGEATLVPYEYNETNNVLITSLKVRLLGDLNGDGRVDLDDVLTVSLAFGSYPGCPNWDPNADIYRDNKIDLADVLAVCLNFGNTC